MAEERIVGLPTEPPLETRLANLRAWKARALAKGATLAPVLEARLQALEAAALDERVDRASQAFRARFPALQQWALQILRTQGKRTPLEIAAAYELVAVQCEEVGQFDLAAGALDLAARQFDHADAA